MTVYRYSQCSFYLRPFLHFVDLPKVQRQNLSLVHGSPSLNFFFPSLTRTSISPSLYSWMSVSSVVHVSGTPSSPGSEKSFFGSSGSTDLVFFTPVYSSPTSRFPLDLYFITSLNILKPKMLPILPFGRLTKLSQQ